ncbi:nitroreductase family protein [Thiovibrio sp. JS02]
MAATRTCRRFYEEQAIAPATLRELIELARLGGSARNAQPLRYLLAADPALNARIFPHLAWAAYLGDWQGPEPGERPAAYIVCLLDTRVSRNADCDLGIASQNILLGATALGLAGCRIASVSGKLHKELDLPSHLKILLVLALGKAREKVVLEEVGTEGNIRYWRDKDQIHHVPKRSLAELIIPL